MPSIQFSWAPWNFDQETIDITKTFVNLHQNISDYIIHRMELAIKTGEPVNVPIWWLDETDVEAQTIDDGNFLKMLIKTF
jgi:alpha-glucosidase